MKASSRYSLPSCTAGDTPSPAPASQLARPLRPSSQQPARSHPPYPTLHTTLSNSHSRTRPAARQLRAPPHCLPYAALNLRTASSMSGRLPNALARTKPSPAGPKPLPGVVTMLHFSRISANTSHELRPGKPTQM